jgi:AcrR family transcriptional regulator
MLGTGQDQQHGLRERKKARTRASLREHALRLFREQGYQATTVEQIAAAAEVSPSTFFRYFPTKEDVVLQDDMDIRMAEAVERQPAGQAPRRMIAIVSEALAKRTGRAPDDLAVRATVGAWVGVIMSITLPLAHPSDRQGIQEMFQRIDEALALLEAGLPL